MKAAETVKSLAHQLNPISYAEGLFDAGVQRPWNAISQLAPECIPQVNLVSEHNDSLAFKAGNVTAFALEAYELSRVAGATLDPCLKGFRPAVVSTATLAATGAVWGGLLTPTSEGKGLLSHRMYHAVTGALTFGIMGGLGGALREMPVMRNWEGTIVGTTVAGGVGGLLGTAIGVPLEEQRIPTWKDLSAGAIENAALGAKFGSLMAFRPETKVAGIPSAPPEVAPVPKTSAVTETNMVPEITALPKTNVVIQTNTSSR